MADPVSSYLGYRESRKARKRQDKLNNENKARMEENYRKSDELFNKAMSSQEANTNFYVKMLENTNNKYGNIEQNINSFYENLSGDKLATRAKEGQQKAFQDAVSKFKENNARRGLSGSEFEAKQLGMMTMMNYSNKAQTGINAEFQAVEAQQDYLNQTLRPERNFWQSNLVNSKEKTTGMTLNKSNQYVQRGSNNESRLQGGLNMYNAYSAQEQAQLGALGDSILDAGMAYATGGTSLAGSSLRGQGTGQGGGSGYGSILDNTGIFSTGKAW